MWWTVASLSETITMLHKIYVTNFALLNVTHLTLTWCAEEWVKCLIIMQIYSVSSLETVNVFFSQLNLSKQSWIYGLHWIQRRYKVCAYFLLKISESFLLLSGHDYNRIVPSKISFWAVEHFTAGKKVKLRWNNK